MENQTFKLSKTGIIIIAVSVVVVILLGIILYVAGKKQQEINKLQQEKEDRTEPKTENAVGDDVSDDAANDEQYYQIFDDLKAGKINNKQAVKECGLSVGTFYRKLRKYEAKG